MIAAALLCSGLTCLQPPPPPKAEDQDVNGTVSQLKIIENLVQGERVRMVDIQLNWKKGNFPVLVSSNPASVLFQSSKYPELHRKEGTALVLTESALRHTWTVRLPGEWMPREPWRCLVEGSSVVVDRFVDIPLGRVGDLIERLKQGPVEATKDGKFRCLIVKLDRRGNRFSVRIRVEIDSGGVSLESYHSWVVFNRLESKVGDQVREPFGYSIEAQESSFAEVTYHLPAGLPADAMLYYRTLANLRKAPIRLDFKGIPPW